MALPETGPYADCHLHLEGSIPVALLREMAKRCGHRFAVPGALEEARAASRDPAAFLSLYREVCGLFRRPQDYGAAARSVAESVAADGVGYFEVYVSPEIPARSGLDPAACLQEIAAALGEAEKGGAVKGRILLDTVRQWGVEAAERVLDLHERTRHAGVVGFGLGGDENALPAGQFAGVYARARSLGLRTSVHAGEWGGPEAVRDALDALRPDRIDHGIAAAADPDLMRRLAEESVVLWVAPTSNVATGAVGDWGAHPLARLLEGGVSVALSADDPLLFETSTSAEYLAAGARLGMPAASLRRMAENAWSGAFSAPAERRDGLRRLRASFRGAQAPGGS